MDPLGSGRGQSWEKLPKALALKVFRPCPCRAEEVHVFPAGFIMSLRFTNTLGHCSPPPQQLPEPVGLNSFLIFLTLSVPREVQPHLFWILASVTWKGSHNIKAEPFTSLA